MQKLYRCAGKFWHDDASCCRALRRLASYCELGFMCLVVSVCVCMYVCMYIYICGQKTGCLGSYHLSRKFLVSATYLYCLGLTAKKGAYYAIYSEKKIGTILLMG